MRIVIGSDHAGFELKSALKQWLIEHGHDVTDVGTDSTERADYPHYGALVAETVASGMAERGVAVCGSGQGICMTVNKVDGVRGGIIRDREDAEMTRRHNDANVACFGGRVTAIDEAISALSVFLDTPFEGGRHADRVNLMSALERGESI